LSVVISIAFYLIINPIIIQKGFSLPDSIIPDSLINSLIEQQTGQFVQGDKYIAQITPEMIDYAKQHPELLKQYGITPEQLNQFTQSQPSSAPSKQGSSPKSIQVPTTTTDSSLSNPSTAMVKKMALEPINKLIKQYQNLVAPILALLLFSGFSFFFFFFFLLNLLSGFTIKIIFYLLEKTNFFHFEKEMREVKKLVV
jgi:predicted PurR-regulated permease PerM